MKFTTAISVIAATSTALPECFGSEPTSINRAPSPNNGVRRQDSAAAATKEKKTKNRESRQFRRMRSLSGTLKNRKFLNRNNNNNNNNDMVADTTHKTTNVECDPTAFSQADIGILHCQNHEALFGNSGHDDIRVACLEDPESSLGGFCSEIVTPPFSARQLQLSPSDVYYWCYDTEYADWNCNCDDFDEYTYSALDCSYQYCSDCAGGNCSQDTFSTVVTYGGREWTVSRYQSSGLVISSVLEYGLKHKTKRLSLYAGMLRLWILGGLPGGKCGLLYDS